MQKREASGYLWAVPPSKKAVEAQLAVFNVGKGIGHIFQTDEIYKMWEELLQITDAKARDAQLRKIGNYKFEHFETIPLFDVFIEVVRLSRLGSAALAAGTAKAVLDYVVPYVNERQAFGEPISHRQAVAFSVADIAIELEGLRLVTLRAAARAEQGKEYAREAALARKLATDKGMQIGNAGVQLLGGHGFVKEHPVERWYRDLRAIGVMEGAVLL